MVVQVPAWLARLRRREIVQPVLNDPRSVGYALLGAHPHQVQSTIEWGQANFDEPHGDLTADDRVLLYAYFNQKGRIEELTAVFGHIFQYERPDEPILVDIGCGPFTGGLAFAGVLPAGSRFDYIGIDRSEAMLRLGRSLAAAAGAMPEAPRFRAGWTQDIADVDWTDPPGWRSVIVVASYLLASPTLNVKNFVPRLNSLLARLGGGTVVVLVTNSPKSAPNRALPVWHARLTEAGFQKSADFTSTIDGSGRPRTRSFRCALWRRAPQTGFRPSGD